MGVGYSFMKNGTCKVNSRENTLEREMDALVGKMRGGGNYSRIIFHYNDYSRQKEGGEEQVNR
jgi:hypothetical protein